MNLLDLIVRHWRLRPMRTLLSAFSVAVAVAAILGSALARTSVRSGNQSLRELVEGPPALDVVAAAGGRIDARNQPRLANIDGVASSFAIVSRATMFRAHGRRMKSILVGLPVEQSAAWNTLPLVAGHYCREKQDATLALDIAHYLGVALGDQLTLLTRHGPRMATVVGLVDARSLNALSLRREHRRAAGDRRRLFRSRWQCGPAARAVGSRCRSGADRRGAAHPTSGRSRSTSAG